MTAIKQSGAFERFTDNDGNLLSSINRDGTITAAGIDFTDGTSQTTAASGGAVSSVFGRTGAVVAEATDYTGISGLRFSDNAGDTLILGGFFSVDLADGNGNRLVMTKSPNVAMITGDAGASVTVNQDTNETDIVDGQGCSISLSGITPGSVTITDSNSDTLTVGAGSVTSTAPVSAPTIIESSTLSPTSAATAGITGQIAWDASFIYVCTAGGAATHATWKKAALSPA